MVGFGTAICGQLAKWIKVVKKQFVLHVWDPESAQGLLKFREFLADIIDWMWLKQQLYNTAKFEESYRKPVITSMFMIYKP